MKRIDRVIPISEITPNPNNARTHSKKQVQAIANSIRAFGFVNPVVVDSTGLLIAGHGRLEAAKLLGMAELPAIQVDGLSSAKKRALMLADNKIASRAGWDREKLVVELQELEIILKDEDLEITITGFEVPEIDALCADFSEQNDPADVIPQEGNVITVSRRGDLWQLGSHRLLCGDARDDADVHRLMDDHRAAMAFIDPPYNVKVSDIGGRGRTKHPEFEMASGEMSRAEFTAFLKASLGCLKTVVREGGLAYVCMDWKHIGDLLLAAEATFDALVNICVWAKSNAGQGSFYRSQHEFVAVLRNGPGPHVNNIELGRHGRSRSNVWNYAGVNSFKPGRMDELTVHPTVKPVLLVADAMKDATRRGAIVVDTFCGSGTTIMAAERVGRRGFGMEIDPGYVDVAVRRWQLFTGRDAINEASGATFEEEAVNRQSSVQADAVESAS